MKTDSGTFVRIIDYKTGSKTFSLSNMFYGLDIQLMVYLSSLTEPRADYKKSRRALFLNLTTTFTKRKTRGEMDKSYEKDEERAQT
ncbi:MAG: PD-(D/E)XK nuclease family protein [Clostridiales bacterium]|nr:MAG: PD-(D/E)XK nuclease family protein [Clostridiales bacterium]